MAELSKKELDELYNTALAYDLGRGVESSMIMAMECYHEYLEAATPKHSKFLSAHYHLAKISTKMGDMYKDNDMDEEAKDWYDTAIEHYETITVKHPKVAFNDRLLAEVAYEKLREKLNGKSKEKRGFGSFFKKIFG